MPEHHFESHRPIELYVEIGKGSLTVTCTDTTETRVSITGSSADDVAVVQRDDTVHVAEPHRSGLFRDTHLDVVVTCPTGSSVGAKTGSADVTVHGSCGDAQVRTGSGGIGLDDVQGTLRVETGSGDLRAGRVTGAARVKSGSGDLSLDATDSDLQVSTGSGDIRVGETRGATSVKTGSGDLSIGGTHHELTMTTGSGDLQVRQVHAGRVTVKAASGDVALGIRAGVPVWTDVTTVSGSIRSDLQGAGQPQEGQDHIEVRARTVSGDVVLAEV